MTRSPTRPSSLQFHDMLNRGVERAAQRRGFDLLLRSVDISDHDAGRRVLAIARKSDGLILHDGVLEPGQIDEISRQVPIVTLAGIPSPTTANVGSDNVAGMRALARHLLYDHGYTTLGFLSGYSDSPDSQARLQTLAAEAEAAGAVLHTGPQWRGNYYAAGAAVVTERILASDVPLPRVIVCANDQTALGVMQALRRSGVDVPGKVAVTGFDDIPMARHVHPLLTTVRQPIGDLGETAFEVLYSMIGREAPAERDIVAAHPADVPGELRLPGRLRAAGRSHRPVHRPAAPVLSHPARGSRPARGPICPVQAIATAVLPAGLGGR